MNCLHPLVLSIKTRYLFLSICVLITWRVIHVIFLFFIFALWKAGKFSMIAFLRSNGKTYYYSEHENSDYFSLISLQSPSLILDILLMKSLILLKFLGLITCRGILSVLQRQFRPLIYGKRLYGALFKIY